MIILPKSTLESDGGLLGSLLCMEGVIYRSMGDLQTTFPVTDMQFHLLHIQPCAAGAEIQIGGEEVPESIWDKR